MKTKIQIKSVSGEILFEFKKENNSIKDTLKEFLKKTSKISNADLSNLNLSGIEFNDINFYNSRFDGSSFYNSRFDGSSFDNSRFDGSSFYNSWFDGLSFDNSSFDGSSFYNSRFDDSSFDNSSFDGSSFFNSSFYNSSFDNCMGIEEIIAKSRILPDGDLIGWKKCKNNVLVKLLIPAKAKRSNAFGRKCRAEYVKTLKVIGAEVGVSQYDENKKYIKGKITKCDKWDENFQNECSGGIHFFITRLEAEGWC